LTEILKFDAKEFTGLIFIFKSIKLADTRASEPHYIAVMCKKLKINLEKFYSTQNEKNVLVLTEILSNSCAKAKILQDTVSSRTKFRAQDLASSHTGTEMTKILLGFIKMSRQQKE
jgi:hypothetical protein